MVLEHGRSDEGGLEAMRLAPGQRVPRGAQRLAALLAIVRDAAQEALDSGRAAQPTAEQLEAPPRLLIPPGGEPGKLLRGVPAFTHRPQRNGNPQRGPLLAPT